MSYTVDLEQDDLRCRNEYAAVQASALINADPWMRRHLEVQPVRHSFPDRADSWALVVETFDGCSWNEPSARGIWLALAPFMADDATIEFRHEEGGRSRIRWHAGRVFVDSPKQVIWAMACELTYGS